MPKSFPSPTFDLQSHSTSSDGSLPPAEVVRRAARAGVQLLALTDHDSVSGIPEALQAATAHHIRLVPAIELSARDTRGSRELHILGYRIDPHDPELASRLEQFRADRERRTLAIADALSELGIELDRDAIARSARAGQAIGRPHLAEAALRHPANRDRLRAEGIRTLGEFFEAYLTPRRPAFRPRHSPAVEEVIELIHRARGLAVWAHPFRNVSRPEDVLATIDRLRPLQLDGVEAFYITHTREQTELLARRAGELDLLSSGSSDFHGPNNPPFSRFLAFELYGLQPELGPIGEPG